MSSSSGPAGSWPLRWAIVGLLAVIVVMAGTLVANLVARPVASGSALGSPAPTSGSSTSAATPSASPATPAPTPTREPTPTLMAAPLTGLLVTPEVAAQRATAVMIDDHVLARPQAGFNAASIVWHAPAEGGIPRYMLVFQDQIPGTVGPVRSSRQYFIEWAAEWRAMYVHAGGSPQALQTLALKGHGQYVWNADDFRWEGTYLWRVHGTRFPPHNVFTDGAHLRKLATRLGAVDAPLKGAWSFGPDETVDSRPIGGTIKVSFPYESITYRYDSATNTYVRYINASKTPQVDFGDKHVVAPRNVVILRMAFGPLNDGHPAKERLEAADIGHGVAWIATGGRTVKGTWRKASITAPTLLFGPDGSPVTLTAGQTFIEVVPLTDAISIHDGAQPTTARLDGVDQRLFG